MGYPLENIIPFVIIYSVYMFSESCELNSHSTAGRCNPPQFHKAVVKKERISYGKKKILYNYTDLLSFR